MANILSEDENSITYETPQGPLKVAKNRMNPFQQAATVNTDPQVSPETIAGAPQAPQGGSGFMMGPGAITSLRVPRTSATEMFVPNSLLEAKPATHPEIQSGSEAGQFKDQAAPVSQEGGAIAQQNALGVTAPSRPNGMNQYERGLRKEADLAAKAGAQQAGFYQGLEDQMAAQQKAKAERELQKEKAFEDHYKSIEESQKQLAQMQPRDFWADKSTGSKITAGLSVMLGALGGAMDGSGTNQAVSTIENAMEQDLKRQMLSRDIAKEDLAGKQNLFQMRMGQYKDKDMAEAAVRSDMLQGVELQVKKMQAGMSGDQAKAKLDQVLGDIQMKRDAANQELAAKLAEKQMQFQKDIAPRMVPGYGVALSPESAKDLRKQSGSIRSAQQGIDELLKISGQNMKSLDPATIAKANVTRNMLQGALRELIVGPGAVSEFEQKLLQETIANPTKFFSLDEKNKSTLETLKKAIEKKFKANLEAEGLQAQNKPTIETQAR